MKMKKIKISIKLLFLTTCLSLMGCEDFVEVDTPTHLVSSEVVFEDEITAQSAMTGIYNQLIRASFCGGWEDSVSVLAGLSSDNLIPLWETNVDYLAFDRHNLRPDNPRNLALWSSAYNLIYMCNAVLEGVEASAHLDQELRERLEGEAKTIRAFTYFYLVNLYGEVPLILHTDYRVNAVAAASTQGDIYTQMLADLQDALDLLPTTYREQDRRYVNAYVAQALLARIHLYLGEYEQAADASDALIAQEEMYGIAEDPNSVFLANSKEAIWQISPIGMGGSQSYTYDAYVMIIDPNASSLNPVQLDPSLREAFANTDRRLEEWIGYDEATQAYYAHKYKDRSSTGNITEYSMVMRLAEQYLIRAEARAQQGNLAGALEDLDKIRQRAHLPLLVTTAPNIPAPAILDSIAIERRRELFTEWGHRWLDLKRTAKTDEVWSDGTENWQATDVRYPIPEEERKKNPNLAQNPGY